MKSESIETSTSRRRRRIDPGVILLLVLAILLIVQGVARAQTKVVFGTASGLGDNSLAVFVAIDRGFYKEVGIAPEVVDFKGGAPAIQALIGGSIQYCICAPEHVVRLRSRGIDGVVTFALDARHTYALLVRDASAVRNWADLRGKRVGITSAGSLTENLVRLAAKRAGVDATKDLELIGAGPGAAQKAALDTGRIEAGMFANYDALQLVGKGYRIVYDWRTQVVPSLGLLTRERVLAENPKAARAVAQATLRAQTLLLHDKAVAVDALRKLYPKADAVLIEQLAVGLPQRLDADGLYTREAFDRLQTDLVDLEPELKRVDFNVAAPSTYPAKAGN